LFYYSIHYLTRNNNSEGNNDILKSYLNKSTDPQDKQDISTIVQSINNLKEGNDFPNIDLIDFENNNITMGSLINKPTVIYFWSHKFNNHFKESHYKTNELSIKYPEISFISINVDDSGTTF